MRKKWWLAIGLFLMLAVALGIGIPAFLAPTPGVTYANFSRIEIGMARSDVVAIMGPPSLALVNGDLFEDLRRFSDGKEIPDSYYWHQSGDGQAQIHFDNNDRVTMLFWDGWQDDRQGWQKLRDRLPLIAKKPPAPLAIY